MEFRTFYGLLFWESVGNKPPCEITRLGISCVYTEPSYCKDIHSEKNHSGIQGLYWRVCGVFVRAEGWNHIGCDVPSYMVVYILKWIHLNIHIRNEWPSRLIGKYSSCCPHLNCSHTKIENDIDEVTNKLPHDNAQYLSRMTQSMDNRFQNSRPMGPMCPSLAVNNIWKANRSICTQFRCTSINKSTIGKDYFIFISRCHPY